MISEEFELLATTIFDAGKLKPKFVQKIIHFIKIRNIHSKEIFMFSKIQNFHSKQIFFFVKS